MVLGSRTAAVLNQYFLFRNSSDSFIATESTSKCGFIVYCKAISSFITRIVEYCFAILFKEHPKLHKPQTVLKFFKKNCNCSALDSIVLVRFVYLALVELCNETFFIWIFCSSFFSWFLALSLFEIHTIVFHCILPEAVSLFILFFSSVIAVFGFI